MAVPDSPAAPIRYGGNSDILYRSDNGGSPVSVVALAGGAFTAPRAINALVYFGVTTATPAAAATAALPPGVFTLIDLDTKVARVFPIAILGPNGTNVLALWKGHAV